MNFSVLLDYSPLILAGGFLTIGLALCSLALATLIGIFCALGKLQKNPIFFIPLNFYTTVFRGVPELVLMLVIYYGGQILLNQFLEIFYEDAYFEINPFLAGVVTLGLVFGAYMGETFRGAILSIKKGQIEAAHAFGFSGIQTFFRITLPQMLIHALPGFSNNWQVLLKSTALVSILGLEDLVRNAKLAGDNTKLPFTFLFAGALVYLLISWISMVGLNRLRKQFPFAD